MKQQSMISQFVQFVFLMLMLWVGVTYVSQNIQYSSAKRFHGNVVEQLENSYFDNQIIKDCERNAKESGYQLTIKTYGDIRNRDATVSLKFSFIFPVIRVEKEYIIEGYAR